MVKAKSECFLCLLKQAYATAKIAQCDEDQIQRVVLEVAKILGNLGDSSHVEPPLLAIGVYAKISEILGDLDPYKTLKAQSIALAKKITLELEESKALIQIPREESHSQRIVMKSRFRAVSSQDVSGNIALEQSYKIKRKSKNHLASSDFLAHSCADSSVRRELAWALRVAVLGNVIDYGAQKSFSLEKERDKIFNTPFACDDFEYFLDNLLRARRIVYLGDNAGENIFDKALLRSIHEANPCVKIHYFTRGRAIINDLTFEEAQACEMEGLCELVDSGVPSPGFVYELANVHAREIYDEADLILSKGMGNFEVLESHPDERLFMLFKVKCEVVARHVGFPLGSFVFRQNIKHERGI